MIQFRLDELPEISLGDLSIRARTPKNDDTKFLGGSVHLGENAQNIGLDTAEKGPSVVSSKVENLGSPKWHWQ